MKKRLLTKTLLVAAMLVGGVISIWADDEIIFSMTGVPNEKITIATGETQSITATFNTGSSAGVYNGHATKSQNMINSGKINLSGSGNSWFHAHFTTPLEEGDIITSSTSAKFYIAPTSTKPTSSVTLPYTIPANSDFIGETDVYVWKDEGSSFTSFTITRPAPPTSPVITKQPKSAKYKVDATPTALTVEATASAGDLSYQWYSNTTGTADPDNDTAISGATSATLDASSISTTTLGTTYYYCVLTDDNGSTTSSVAAITIAQEFTVTFEKGEGSGIAPAPQSNILDGDKIYLPENHTMYKEGYTLTGWNDGSKTYAPGKTYKVSADITLTAVYTENTVTLDDRDSKSPTEIYWQFSQQEGVPAIDLNYGGTQKTGFVVAQANIGDDFIDVPLWIDCSQTEGAKFVNRNDPWTQVNPGTKFTIPSVEGATIIYEQYGVEESIEIQVESSDATYTLTAEGTSGQLYYKYIHIVLPPTEAKLYSVTYAAGEGSGVVPAALSNIEEGTEIDLPMNYSMYKEGYTMTGWTDGNDEYELGKAYPVTKNVTLTAVYTQNTVSLDDRDGEVYIDWNFSQDEGVPAIDLNYGGTQSGFVVARAYIGENIIDVPLWIDCSQTEGAKFVNRNDPWTQVNPGTKFTIPSAEGATIVYEKYDNGEEIPVEIPVESSDATYTLTAEGTSGQLYYNHIMVILPYIEPTTAPTINIYGPTGEVYKDVDVVLTTEVTGNPEPTIQWYSNTTNEAVVDDNHKIAGATGLEYSPSTSEVGTTYYYAVATNSEGSVTSGIVMLNVVLVLSNECELTSIRFSNTTYGAITDPSGNTHGKIEVPYLAGTEAPTATTNVGISDKATYDIEGNTLTVTAEDGETTAIFDIVKTPITPLAVPDDIETTTFTEVPSWIFNRYGFDTDKGVKFAKAVNETNNKRISKGNTRQYYFISAATKLTLTSGSGGARIINVYRNGELLNTPTSTSSSGKTIDIALDETAPCMIEIESNQTSGDGGFTKFSITGITVSATMGLNGYTTFASSSPLDLANLPEGLKAYTATLNGATLSFHQCRQAVAAGTGLLLAGEGGETYCIPKATTGESVTNDLYGVTSQKNLQSSSNTYYFAMKKAKSADDPLTFAPISSTSAVAFPAGKAYLKVSADVFSTGEARALTVSFGDGATGISSILNAQTTMHDDVYTLQGQRVATPKKGLYIVNGRLVVIK